MKKIICAAVLIAATMFTAAGQSKTFRLGQWIEIQNSLLRELNRTYVDSLPVDRMMKAGIDAMLEELDPYTVFIPEEENEDLQMMISKTYGGIGAIIHKKKGENVIINEPYANSPAQKYGLHCGDEIMEIDGVPVLELESKEASDRMKGKPGTSVKFKVKKVRSGEIVELSVVRERIHMPDVEYVGMLDDTTGYILQSGFTDNVSDDVRAAFLKLKSQGMKRFVLDLRGNGGGLLQEAVKIVSLFVPKGTLVVTSRGNSPQTVSEYRTSTEPIDTEMPVIVLIDSASASASEIVSGALQDLDRATIMGKRSYGKGLVQSIRPIAYNGQLKVTTAKYYTPSGRCVQARDYSNRNEDGSVGFIPDSLTREFRTAAGRVVRDGGGITPDVDVDAKSYSRIVYALVLGGIIDNFAIEYCRHHDSLPAPEDFHLSEAGWEEFVSFARGQNFDHRSGAMAYFDKMKEELEEDGLDDIISDDLAALKKKLELGKEEFIRLKKDEILPFIEEELVIRYHFQEAGVKIRLRYDTQLHDALSKYGLAGK